MIYLRYGYIINKGVFFMNALAIGEVLWDIYPTSNHLGGATLNFAAHFSKCGGDSWILSAVGRDELGQKALEEIKRLRINTEFLSFSESKETGKCLVSLDKDKIPFYNLLNHVAYDEIIKPDLSDKTFDVLYFGTLALRNKNNYCVLNQIIKENKFNEHFVDVNIRAPYYSDFIIKFALENATIIKISDEELPVVIQSLGETCLSHKECSKTLKEQFNNLRIIIITRGDKGSFVYDAANDRIYECQSERVDVVSTVGAGDSFSASFLATYIKTKDIEKSLRLATAISAFVVSKKDAIPEYILSDFEQGEL